jgi:hypothetical protein
VALTTPSSKTHSRRLQRRAWPTAEIVVMGPEGRGRDTVPEGDPEKMLTRRRRPRRRGVPGRSSTPSHRRRSRLPRRHHRPARHAAEQSMRWRACSRTSARQELPKKHGNIPPDGDTRERHRRIDVRQESTHSEPRRDRSTESFGACHELGVRTVAVWPAKRDARSPHAVKLTRPS